jgi:hypothetical protein
VLAPVVSPVSDPLVELKGVRFKGMEHDAPDMKQQHTGVVATAAVICHGKNAVEYASYTAHTGVALKTAMLPSVEKEDNADLATTDPAAAIAANEPFNGSAPA